MDFHIVDMVIIGLILILSIRGLINGFSKELFNFLSLIGGIAIAARSHSVVGEFITKQNLLPNLSGDFQRLIAFAIVLILILIFFKILSSLSSNEKAESPGVFSRLLGYIISVARNVSIFSLIILGINNADFLKEKLAKHYQGSHLFSPMVKIGSKLLNVNQHTNEENNETTLNREENLSEGNLSINIDTISLTDHNISN